MIFVTFILTSFPDLTLSPFVDSVHCPFHALMALGWMPLHLLENPPVWGPSHWVLECQSNSEEVAMRLQASITEVLRTRRAVLGTSFLPLENVANKLKTNLPGMVALWIISKHLCTASFLAFFQYLSYFLLLDTDLRNLLWTSCYQTV